MKYYLAGPMTGIPQFNFPAFDSAARHLRLLGYQIVTPSELDSPAERAAALASKDGIESDTEMTWGDFLARDVKLLADECDAIIMLQGWRNSRGACLELFVAMAADKPAFLFTGAGIAPLNVTEIVNAIDKRVDDYLRSQFERTSKTA